MRLLSPNHQQKILNKYLRIRDKNSDFYIPDCASHINARRRTSSARPGGLDQLHAGVLRASERHQHGKTTPHTAAGGGGATQVVFLPSSTETAEHRSKFLFDISLLHKTVASDNYTHASAARASRRNGLVLGIWHVPGSQRYLAYLIDEIYHRQQARGGLQRVAVPALSYHQ